MSNILTAVVVGIVAGTIDMIPMIIMKLEKRATISAFIHYFALGIIIPFVDWGDSKVGERDYYRIIDCYSHYDNCLSKR